jgi:hypothetical protein
MLSVCTVLKHHGGALMPAPGDDETREALIMLLDWATSGNRTGNPYCMPAVKLAIKALQDTKKCPATWQGILSPNKTYSDYLQEAVQEHDKRKQGRAL